MAIKRLLSGPLVVICMYMLRQSNGNIYSASFRLKDAFSEEIKTTKVVLESMKKFDKRISEEEIVKEFASFIEETRMKHSKLNSVSQAAYMEHPINIYHVVKRMAKDWPEKVESINQVVDMEVLALQATLEAQINTANIWPRTMDFDAVTLQLISMQAVYLLDITEFATGTLNGTRTDPLTLDEILTIGRTAYDRNMFYEASLWFRGLVNCFENGMKESRLVTKRKTLKYLASTYYRYENYIKAIDTIKEALAYEPGDASLEADLKYYEEKLEAARENGEDPDKPLKHMPPDDVYFKENFANYYALCRNDVKRPPSYVKRLKCRWKKTAVPYRPAKQEFLNIRPPIVLYHDVISDQETKQITELAKGTMIKSGVIANDGTVITHNDMRVSETSWLDDSLRLVAKLSRRIAEITGLSTKLDTWPPHAEPLQVLSYGVGGMYVPHYDFQLVPDPKGERIATWMFYGSDVKVGGRTVFPLLNVSVPVSKGSAAFWPNKLLNGTVDLRTMHAGCPVAIGSKWVMNKWVRDYGQFNKWPCSTYKHKANKLT